MSTSRRKIFLLLFILTFLVISQCQRGRGGGGGGGRSSSSSSSRSSSSSSSWSSSYRSSSYRSYGSGGGTASAGQTIGIIAGSVCLVFCCIGCAVSDWKSLVRSMTNRQNDTQILDAQFQRLKAVKNNVSTIIMKQKHFQNVKRQFFQMIQASQSIFQYTQNGQSTRIYNTKIKDQPEGQFIDKIFLQGSDEVGSWTGRGYFLASVEGPYVWWMKDYNNKQAAGQVGDSEFLIYESTSYYQGRWQGKWYYQGDQNDQIYSGSWSLYDPSNQFAIDSMTEQSPRKWNPFDVLGGRLNAPPL